MNPDFPDFDDDDDLSLYWQDAASDVVANAVAIVRAECETLLAIEQMHAEVRCVLDAAARINRRAS